MVKGGNQKIKFICACSLSKRMEMKPGVRGSTEVCHVGGRHLITWTITAIP